MSDKKLTLSIVIPVYNEQDYLAACLDSIAAQKIMPSEVIVVDNNSTDQTVAIAKKYKFVKLIHETKQGSSFAQKTGFERASGDLIGRIDADTVLAKDWVQNASDYFSRYLIVDAVTGQTSFNDFPIRRTAQAIHSFFYQTLQHLVTGSPTLWGSNMVIRRTAWQSVKKACLLGLGVNEDVDLSIKLRLNSQSIKRTNALKAEASLRRGDLGLISGLKYVSSWPKNYWRNNQKIEAAVISLIATLAVILCAPVFLIVNFSRSTQPSLIKAGVKPTN